MKYEARFTLKEARFTVTGCVRATPGSFAPVRTGNALSLR